MRLSEIMGRVDLTVYPIVALVLFVAVFVGVIARTYSRRARSEMDRAGHIPLTDEVVTPRDERAPSTPEGTSQSQSQSQSQSRRTP